MVSGTSPGGTGTSQPYNFVCERRASLVLLGDGHLDTQ